MPEQSAASSSTPKEEPTGLENVRYDVVTNQGAPDNPKHSREVVERGVVNVAPAKSSASSSGIDRKIAAYRAYIDSLPELETPEKRAKREKLEKSKKIIGAVSDGLRAMSNLWYASQYAPDMYNHEKDSQLKETNRWIEQAKAERQKNLDEHLRFAIALGDAENERARTMRELEEQQERRKLARDKAKQDAERFNFEKSLWGGKKREQDGKTSKAEQQAITAKVEAEAAPELQQAKIATEIARKNNLNASASASGARADYYRNGGSAGTKKHHFRGKEYVSEKDYTKDVTEAARQYNERHMEEVEVDDGNGGKKRQRQYKPGFVPIETEREEHTGFGTRIVARKPEEYAGEVERRLEQENAGKKKTNVNWK